MTNDVVPNINNSIAVLIIVSAIIAVTVFNNIISEVRIGDAERQRDNQTAEILSTQRELDMFAEINANETRQILDRLVESADRQNEILIRLDQIATSNQTEVVVVE